MVKKDFLSIKMQMNGKDGFSDDWFQLEMQMNGKEGFSIDQFWLEIEMNGKEGFSVDRSRLEMQMNSKEGFSIDRFWLEMQISGKERHSVRLRPPFLVRVSLRGTLEHSLQKGFTYPGSTFSSRPSSRTLNNQVWQIHKDLDDVWLKCENSVSKWYFKYTSGLR